jgi:hypothetical protein
MFIRRVYVNNKNTINIIPPIPNLLSPLNESKNQPISLYLYWDTSIRADHYHVQVASDSLFESKVLNDSTLSATFLAIGPLEKNMQYYWRIKAMNANGSSAWSFPPWCFSTILQYPKKVVLVYPINGATFITDSVRLTWNKCGVDIVKYCLEISNNSLMNNSIIDSTFGANDTTKVIRNLSYNKTYWWQVKAKNIAGWGAYSVKRKFIIIMSDVENIENLPKQYCLKQNYPNPFNPSTNIEYQLPKDSYVTLRVFNIKGELVKTCIEEKQSTGYYKIQWSGRDENDNSVVGGLYIYQLKAADFSQSNKMVLIK